MNTKKTLVMFTILGLAISLTGCFPTKDNNYSIKKESQNKRVESIDTVVKKIPKHINKNVNNNFDVDADVEIRVSNNMNIYTAEGLDISFDDFSNVMEPDSKITEHVKDEYMETNTFKNGGFIAKYNDSLGQHSYIFKNKYEYTNRNIEWIYSGSNDYNGKINFEKDQLWERKDLSFMTNEESCKMVQEKLDALGIDAVNIEAYAIDEQYLKERETWYNSQLFEGDEEVSYSLEDEFYLVIGNVKTPNDSDLPATVYYLGDEAEKEVSSSIIYAVVNNSGIIYFECTGIYSNYADNGKADEIVTVESALENLIDYYKEVVYLDPVVIKKIELAYVPYVDKAGEKTFLIKPTWIFYIEKECSDGTSLRCCRYVDAVEGERIIESYEELF